MQPEHNWEGKLYFFSFESNFKGVTFATAKSRADAAAQVFPESEVMKFMESFWKQGEQKGAVEGAKFGS